MRDLRRHQPGIKCVAIEVSFVATHPQFPSAQRHDLDVNLLARAELDVLVLIEVATIALGRDVIVSGRNIAVERAAVSDRTGISLVYVDIREIKALGGFPGSIEPDPSLTPSGSAARLPEVRPLPRAPRSPTRAATARLPTLSTIVDEPAFSSGPSRPSARPCSLRCHRGRERFRPPRPVAESDKPRTRRAESFWKRSR